jgi:hypothetical protein
MKVDTSSHFLTGNSMPTKVKGKWHTQLKWMKKKQGKRKTGTTICSKPYFPRFRKNTWVRMTRWEFMVRILGMGILMKAASMMSISTHSRR